jgi:hypothetical protein
MLHCSITGVPLSDSGDGIYDDGEWISWRWINQFIEADANRARQQAQPNSKELKRLLLAAAAFESRTGHTSSGWGEIGERFAEEQFGLKRHKPGAQGSDGKIGNEFVEVKTITPGKGERKIQVKRAGNFSQLIVVNVRDDRHIEAALLKRAILRKGRGKIATLSWSTILNDQTQSLMSFVSTIA